MFGANTRFKEDYTVYRNSGTKKIWAELNLTPSEYIEFSQFWEWHKHNFLKERAAMREAFKQAYCEKHHCLQMILPMIYEKSWTTVTNQLWKKY